MRLLDKSIHGLICMGEALDPSKSRFSATTWDETGFVALIHVYVRAHFCTTHLVGLAFVGNILPSRKRSRHDCGGYVTSNVRGLADGLPTNVAVWNRR